MIEQDKRPVPKNEYSVLLELNKELNTLYPKKQIQKQECYVNKKGQFFKTFVFPGSCAICVEYAEDEKEAIIGRFEDGDRFWLEDYQFLEDIIKDVIYEIEN